jgi:hypothetical protein
MILLEVDAKGIAAFELERDAPRPVHMNRIPRWLEASEWMEVESREIHFPGLCHRIQPVEPTDDAFMHVGVNFRGPPLLPQVGQCFASESADHAGVCKQMPYICQYIAYIGIVAQSPATTPPFTAHRCCA